MLEEVYEEEPVYKQQQAVKQVYQERQQDQEQEQFNHALKVADDVTEKLHYGTITDAEAQQQLEDVGVTVDPDYLQGMEEIRIQEEEARRRQADILEEIHQIVFSLQLNSKVEENTQLYLENVQEKMLTVYTHDGKMYLPGSLLSAISDAYNGITIQDKLLKGLDGKRDYGTLNDFYLYGVDSEFIDKALKVLSRNESASGKQDIEVKPVYVEVRPEQESLLKEDPKYYYDRMAKIKALNDDGLTDGFLKIEKKVHSIPQENFFTDETKRMFDLTRNTYSDAKPNTLRYYLGSLMISAIDEETKTRNYNPDSKRL